MVDNKKKSFLTNINPAQLFGYSIVLGGICIIFGTWFGIYFRELSSGTFFISFLSFMAGFINFGVPLGIILYYAYTVNKDKSDALSIEQKADSVYYMGFILTLFAMTASLVALAYSENLRFNSIVINFGLALMTTILGLAIRIMWLQLSSQSLSDAESILKDRINRRSQDLADQTEQVVASITALSNQLSSVSEPLKNSFDKLINVLDVNENINKKLQNLDDSADSAAQSLRIFANLAERLDISVKMLQNNINNDVIDNIDELTSAVTNANPQVIKFDEDLSSSIKNIKGSLEELRDSIQEADEILVNSKNNLETNNSFFKKIYMRIKNFFNIE